MILPLDIIITFSSLIYGLALAHSLSCIAQYIQNKNEIKQYWVWWVWAIIILLLSIGFWVSTYISWKDANIPMKGFVAIVTQSSIFYLSCYLFFNHISEMTKKDLEYEYFKYKRITFILLLIQYFIIFVVFEVIQDNLSIKDIINNILNLPLRDVYTQSVFISNFIGIC